MIKLRNIFLSVPDVTLAFSQAILDVLCVGVVWLKTAFAESFATVRDFSH